MKKINSSCLRDRWLSYKRDPKSLIQLIAVSLAALVTMSALIFIIAYILIKGIPYLTPDLFAWTVIIVLLSLGFEKLFLLLLRRGYALLENH